MKEKISRIYFGSLLVISLSAILSITGSVAEAQRQPSKEDAAQKVAKEDPKTPATAKPPESFHEDWSTITLENSTFDPQPPVLGQKDNVPDNKFTRELLQVRWRSDDPIDLYVVRPKGVQKPPVILVLFSFPHDTDKFKDDHWCDAATAKGYAVVGFVSALTGHRAEHRAPKDWFVSELQQALASSVHDVQMVLNYLTTRGDLDMSRVGMFGQGSGGSIAIMASAADARIRAVDVLTPWGDWPNWMAKTRIVPQDERARYLMPQFLTRVEPLEPVKWLPKVKAKAIRIENIRQDSNVPDICQEHIEAAAPEIAEINQFGDYKAAIPVIAATVFDWIKGQLQPSVEQAANATEKEKSQRIHYYPPAESSTP